MIRIAFRSGAVVLALYLVLLAPESLAAQASASDPFRPYLHVFIAYGIGWLLIAAWILRIGQKLGALSREIESEEAP